MTYDEVFKMKPIITASICLLIAMTLQASPLEPADPDQGKSLYQTYCAACHGTDGRGLVPGVPDLPKRWKDSPPDWQLVFERVRDGFQSPGSPMAMPPRGGADLSDSELRDILAYMKNWLASDTNRP